MTSSAPAAEPAVESAIGDDTIAARTDMSRPPVVVVVSRASV